MLVLSRNRKTGNLNMHVEIDTDPAPRPKWEAAILPVPMRTTEHRDSHDPEDVEWLQESIVQYVDGKDWYPDDIVSVDWNGLRRDIEWLAHQ